MFNLIGEDDRHASVNQRNFEPISERVFPSWEMGYKDVSTEKLGFDTNINPSDQKAFEGLIKGELDFTNDGMKVLQLFFKMS